MGSDLDRLREEYADRARRLARDDPYSAFNRAYLFGAQQRQRATLEFLARQGITRLDGLRILELGCGSGRVLHELLGFGADPGRLHGTDLLPDYLAVAHRRLPHLPLTCADGQHLPYPDRAFDLVLQLTVFSSVLDPAIRRNIAAEMRRVLRPDGLILWYDFWLNPTNRQTRGLRPAEIRGLFPGCAFTFRRVTLAPPIGRALAPRTWLVAWLLEQARIFNTHYLVAIRPLAPG